MQWRLLLLFLMTSTALIGQQNNFKVLYHETLSNQFNGIDLDSDDDGILDKDEGKCEPSFDDSLFPNASFEEYTELPTTFSQLDRLVNWHQVTNATSDFYHNDSYLGATGGLGTAPPTTLGKGFVGAICNGTSWNEYIGGNLLVSMQPDEDYNLTVTIGTLDDDSSYGGEFVGDFVIYGFPTPPAFPIPGVNPLNVISNPIELARVEINIPKFTWTEISVTFEVPEEITSIVIGGEKALQSVLLFDHLRLSLPCDSQDTDDDGIPDYFDLDSDNDGISDFIESGIANLALDSDLNGIIDGLSYIDINNNGLADGIELIYGDGIGTTLIDTDLDNTFDVIDLDSDGDGIPDTIEAFPTQGYQNNDGDVRDDDADEDGVIALFDDNDDIGLIGGTFMLPQNTDVLIANNPDLIFDYLDSDSDGDGQLDSDEGGSSVTGISYQDPNGSVNDPLIDLPDETNGNQEVAYREICNSIFGTPQSFTECNTITLPPIPQGQYFSEAGGNGFQLNVGDLIQDSQTIFIFDPFGVNCYFETEVEIFINKFTTEAQIGNDHAYCFNGRPEVLSPSVNAVATGTISHQWQQSEDGVTFTDIGGEVDPEFHPFDQGRPMWYKRVDTSELNGVSCIDETNVVQISLGGITQVAQINADQIVCAGEAPTVINQTSATQYVGASIDHQWQSSVDGINFTDITGQNNETLQPDVIQQTTWYRRVDTVSDTGFSCREVTNSIMAEINAFSQEPLIENDQTICFDQTPERLNTLTNSVATGFITYQWQSSLDNVNFTDLPGETSAFYQPLPTQNTYYRRVDTSSYNGHDCQTTSNTVSITFEGFIQTGLIGNDQILCAQQQPEEINIQLQTLVTDQLDYQWQSSNDNLNFTDINGATSETYQPPLPNQITWYRRVDRAYSANSECTVPTNAIKLTPLAPLQTPAPAMTIFDCDQNNIAAVGLDINPQLISGGSGTITEYTFIWDNNTPNDPTDDQILQSTSSPQYTEYNLNQRRIIVQVTDLLGCVGSTEITIPERIPLSADIVQVNHLQCIDETGDLSLNIQGGQAPYETSLNSTANFQENKLFYDGLQPQNHTVYVRDARNCRMELPVTINQGVNLLADIDIEYFCTEDGWLDNTVTVTLNDPFLDEQTLVIEIDQEEELDGNQAENVDSGSHELSITHDNGCQRNYPIDIVEYEQLILDLNTDRLNFISAAGEGGEGPYQYRFENGSFGDQTDFRVDETGTYTIYLKDQYDCVVESSVYLEFVDIRIPNYFTPDGDGINEGWKPYHLDNYPDAEIKIYDRYGRFIVQLAVDEFWFGDYEGQLLPTGDYWYVIKFNRIDNNKQLMGNFSLMR